MTTTSYALLGLLVFEGPESDGLSGYEIKQRADQTLRFYWVSPAMSQVYVEMDRLVGHDLVAALDEDSGKRRTRRYRITQEGLITLRTWLAESDTGFPVLKHPVALKLLLGGLLGPDRLQQILKGYLDDLAERRRQLDAVLSGLGSDDAYRYPGLVAEWGLAYFDAEAEVARTMLHRLDELPGGRADPPPDAPMT